MLAAIFVLLVSCASSPSQMAQGAEPKMLFVGANPKSLYSALEATLESRGYEAVRSNPESGEISAEKDLGTDKKFLWWEWSSLIKVRGSVGGGLSDEPSSTLQLSCYKYLSRPLSDQPSIDHTFDSNREKEAIRRSVRRKITN